MNKKPARPTLDFSVLWRVIKLLYQFYPRLLPLVGVCIVAAAPVAALVELYTKGGADTVTVPIAASLLLTAAALLIA